MSNVPISELHNLEPSAIIELYELDLTSFPGGQILRFHAGTNELRQDLFWAGNTYYRYNIEISGISQSSSGAFPRPSIKVANIMGEISILLMQYGDLIGAKLTRIRTLKKYIDAINFVSGVNPSADPNAKLAYDVFYIERKVNESFDIVEFECVSPLDLSGLKLPRRQIIQNSCPFKYKSSDCGYAGAAMFDKIDMPTADPLKDSCGKKLKSCKLRFGENAELPFGGFPGAGLIR